MYLKRRKKGIEMRINKTIKMNKEIKGYRKE